MSYSGTYGRDFANLALNVSDALGLGGYLHSGRRVAGRFTCFTAVLVGTPGDALLNRRVAHEGTTHVNRGSGTTSHVTTRGGSSPSPTALA